MKAFVTGGTGFIGGRIVHKLIEGGYTVHALARSPDRAVDLQSAGAVIVPGDITDRESMRSGMAGADVVFHVAGWYKLGSPDWQSAEEVNVTGTRNVLSLAQELGVPRVIYTSTVAVLGDTRGEDLETVDETYRMKSDRFLTEYDRTKWKAHYEVAVPFIEQGAPVIILMPGAVYGPGDNSLVGKMMQAYHRGLFPLFPGPELTLTFAHVDDIAQAHILAAEKGRAGETYIITGEPRTMGEMTEIWSRVSGKARPLAFIPARYVQLLEPLAAFLGRYLPMPEMLSADAVRILHARYGGWPAKAHQELGWGTRDLDEGMRETFEWIAGPQDSAGVPVPRSRTLAGGAILAAFGLLTLYLLRRRRK